MPSPCRRHQRRLHVEPLEPRRLLAVTMSPQEQLLLELVNRARASPEAEAGRFGIELNQEVDPEELISSTPKQPLAPHQALIDAAGLHSQDMLDREFFGHETPEGETPSDRARAAGYPAGAGENIAWFGTSQPINRNLEVYERHEQLFLSTGHRVNMLRDSWREIGPGVRYGEFDGLQAIMVGTLFGNRGGQFFITGVAFTDRIQPNNFYEIGEELGNVTVTAVHNGTGAAYSDRTGPSGGYGIQVPAGTYTVTASGGSLRNEITVTTVRVDGANRKLDFNLRDMPTGSLSGVAFQDLDGDGVRGPTEPPLSQIDVYLDSDNDASRDADEATGVTDAQGRFQFAGLLPGAYTVRAALPTGWVATTAAAHTWDLAANGSVTGIDFGAQASHPWQNTDNPLDVNRDGFVSPIDALLIINEIHRSGPHELTPSPAPPVHFFDVSGDNFLSARDALLVISQINAIESGPTG
jgi:hypothetical protein